VSYHVRLSTPSEDAQLRALGAPVSGLVWTGDEPSPAGPYLRTWALDPNAGLVRNLLTGLFLLLPVDSQL
jgi:putative cardiolipin synthase